MSPANSSTPWPPPFVLNQPVALEEDSHTEFKEVTSGNPVSTIIDTVEEYAVAFLNGSGGRILWGIRDQDRSVVGVSLDAPARDRIRKDVASKFRHLQPAVDPTRFHLAFHPVAGAHGRGELYVVELFISDVPDADPFYTHKGELFVRMNGVKQKLKGPPLTAWIRSRIQKPTGLDDQINDPKLRAHAQRIRRVFAAHGLEPAHLARFLQVRKAPFAITLSDLRTDAALLHWLDESKAAWIARTFLIRKEWIDGEDECIHERFCYDKQPREFFATVSQHADAVDFDETHARSDIYFLRWGVGKEWRRKGEGRVFVILGIPLARLSNQRTIYSYISDFQPYQWAWADYPRTNIQLRAWARLLVLNKQFSCFGREIPYAVGEKLYANQIFVQEVIKEHCVHPRDDWHPEDHAYSAAESRIAKDTETFPQVIQFLRDHDLPCERSG